MSESTRRNTDGSEQGSGPSYLSYPASIAFSGILRRFSSEPSKSRSPSRHSRQSERDSPSDMNGAIYTPQRIASPSPFQPPPLTPLNLHGWRGSTSENARLLSRALAEEIRLLIPARNQLVDRWQLVYSLDQDGSSLSTLYAKAEAYKGKRGGFVLAVRDGNRSVCQTLSLTTRGAC